MENMIKKRTANKVELGEKRKIVGSLGNKNNNNNIKKNKKFLKSNIKLGSNQEGKW